MADHPAEKYLLPVIVVILVIVLIVAIFGYIHNRNKLNSCHTNQSGFCFDLVCPGSTGGSNDPCRGYAQRSVHGTSVPQCAMSVVPTYVL